MEDLAFSSLVEGYGKWTLSLLLFIVAMEVLNRMLICAREHSLLRYLKVGAQNYIEEVTHLFFIDDAMLFCEPDKGMILNLECVLMGFQAVSGLNIKSY